MKPLRPPELYTQSSERSKADFSANFLIFFFVILSFCDTKGKLHRKARLWFICIWSHKLQSLHCKPKGRFDVWCFFFLQWRKKILPPVSGISFVRLATKASKKLHLSCTDSPTPIKHTLGVILMVWLGILRALHGISCASADNESAMSTNLIETSRGSLETLDRLVSSLQGVSRSGGLTWFSRDLRAPAGRWEDERSLVSTWLLQHLHTGGTNGRPV